MGAPSEIGGIIAPVYVRSRGFGQLSSSALQTMAGTIQQIEGYRPGTLAYTNNNPGNLVFVGQAGAVPGAGGFAAFPSYDAGYQALLNQLQNYSNRGLTINQMMAIYAPAGQGGNNPTAYAQSIADALGVSPDTLVADAIAGTGPVDAGINTASAFVLPDLSTVDPVMLAGGAMLAFLVFYAVSR